MLVALMPTSLGDTIWYFFLGSLPWACHDKITVATPISQARRIGDPSSPDQANRSVGELA